MPKGFEFSSNTVLEETQHALLSTLKYILWIKPLKMAAIYIVKCSLENSQLILNYWCSICPTTSLPTTMGTEIQSAAYVLVMYPFFSFSHHIFDKVILAWRQVVFDQGGLLCRVYVVVYYIYKKKQLAHDFFSSSMYALLATLTEHATCWSCSKSQ